MSDYRAHERPTDRIKALLKVIPEDEQGLRHDLQSTYSSACYKPPECAWETDRDMAYALERHTAKYFVPSDKPGTGHPPSTSVNWVAACQRICNGVDPAAWYLDAPSASK